MLYNFITIVGFIIGLGAVTVIDLHGFIGRKSSYWTEATIRTHKITKPLIWIGTFLVLIGHLLSNRLSSLFIIIILVLNGIFLSFVVSPNLIKQEKLGRAKEILPIKLQRKITFSFIISFAGWWSLLFIFVKSIS